MPQSIFGQSEPEKNIREHQRREKIGIIFIQNYYTSSLHWRVKKTLATSIV